VTIHDAFFKAFSLIAAGDAELLGIVFLSLRVSGLALLVGAVIGLLLAVFLELVRIPGRGFLVTLLNTLTGLPPVVVGLLVYILLSRRGPLGFLDLLYTPGAMILAQSILIIPIVASLSHAAVVAAGQEVGRTARCLGATPFEATLAVFKDCRYAIIAAMATAFGRAVAEVGAVLLVGGNIARHTRVMTTAIAMETDKGNFELAIALGLVLLSLSFVVNALFHVVQRRGVKR
jgi:tungstate transport system permease protein